MNITLDEIRSNAPDGATHYKVTGKHVSYFKSDKNGFPLNYNCVFRIWVDSATWISEVKPL